MRRYEHLLYRIPFDEPDELRAFIAQLERLPQKDSDVQATLRQARALLPRVAELARYRDAYKAGTYVPPPILPRDRTSGIWASQGSYSLIERSPSRAAPLEEHRKFIADLETLPQQNVEVQDALKRARRELARAEEFQAGNNGKRSSWFRSRRAHKAP